MPECDSYQPWHDHGVLIHECLEFYQGCCGAELSEHYQQKCPWNGYCCPPRNDQAAPLTTMFEPWLKEEKEDGL